jgi:glycosyltransferase involved in cell wall biosynthesis
MTLISKINLGKSSSGILQSSPKIINNNISIIIPVKNNQTGIDEYISNLDFISHTSYQDTPLEVIIVDNNSFEPLTYLKKSNRTYSITLIKCSKIGPASARNKGASLAKGEYLLFNDSDCVPMIGFINNYITNYKNGVVGYAGNIKNKSSHLIGNYYDAQEILIAPHNENKNPHYLITANCLVLKSAFDKIGGFNESFTLAAGEDIDLGLRLQSQGSLSYCLNSVVMHTFEADIYSFVKRFYRYGRGNKHLSKVTGNSLKPNLFRPQKKSISNYILAFIQFISMYIGYIKV